MRTKYSTAFPICIMCSAYHTRIHGHSWKLIGIVAIAQFRTEILPKIKVEFFWLSPFNPSNTNEKIWPVHKNQRRWTTKTYTNESRHYCVVCISAYTPSVHFLCYLYSITQSWVIHEKRIERSQFYFKRLFIDSLNEKIIATLMFETVLLRNVASRNVNVT